MSECSAVHLSHYSPWSPLPSHEAPAEAAVDYSFSRWKRRDSSSVGDGKYCCYYRVDRAFQKCQPASETSYFVGLLLELAVIQPLVTSWANS